MTPLACILAEILTSETPVKRKKCGFHDLSVRATDWLNVYPPTGSSRTAELYGCAGTVDEATQELAAEVATEVKAADERLGGRVYAGPADAAIYPLDDGHSIAGRTDREMMYGVPALPGDAVGMNTQLPA